MRQVRTLVDELAALSWEKSMQTVSTQDYTEALNRFVSRAIESDRGIDQRDGDGRSALHWAAANGHEVRDSPLQHTYFRTSASQSVVNVRTHTCMTPVLREN